MSVTETYIPVVEREKTQPVVQVHENKTTRFYALDLVRLIAMILMIQGHTLDALVSTAHLDINIFPWNVWNFVRGLTAPIFLMTSGAVHVFANKRNERGEISKDTFSRRIRWGLTLIGIGYLMVFPANRIFDLPWVPAQDWQLFFRVNILQLTGVTLILLMIILSKTRSTRTFAYISLGLGLAITLLSPFVHMINWFAFLPNWLASYFSYNQGSIFPFFPFGAYMFFGVAIGKFLQDTPAERRAEVFPRVSITAGSVIALLGWLTTVLPFSIYPDHDYFMSSPSFVMVRVGLTLLFMGGVGYLYRRTRFLGKYYALFGQKTLHIYIAHLILLYGTPWFHSVGTTYFRSMSLAEGILAAIIIISLCLTGVYLFDYYQRNVRFSRTVRYFLTIVLAYALLV